MRHNSLILTLMFALLLSLTSCEVIGDIFEAGIWTGLIIVVVVIALIIWLINRFRR